MCEHLCHYLHKRKQKHHPPLPECSPAWQDSPVNKKEQLEARFTQNQNKIILGGSQDNNNQHLKNVIPLDWHCKNVSKKPNQSSTTGED